jgi:hypothetical protein
MVKSYYLLLVLGLLCFSGGLLQATELTVIGWIERVVIFPEDFSLEAKIDTGADNSSIDSADWVSFRKDGEEWIRFSVTNNQYKKEKFEKPLIRYTEIKRKKAEPVTRPVVHMDLCIGGKMIGAPVNLADRNNFEYRMLIGRSALEGHFLVDSSQAHTSHPSCLR